MTLPFPNRVCSRDYGREKMGSGFHRCVDRGGWDAHRYSNFPFLHFIGLLSQTSSHSLTVSSFTKSLLSESLSVLCDCAVWAAWTPGSPAKPLFASRIPQTSEYMSQVDVIVQFMCSRMKCYRSSMHRWDLTFGRLVGRTVQQDTLAADMLCTADVQPGFAVCILPAPRINARYLNYLYRAAYQYG